MSEVIVQPSFSWNRIVSQDMKVKDWICPVAELSEVPDVVLLGVPLSRSSISASAASEFPIAFRKSWELFSTYYIDEQVDFRELRVADIGDVKMHTTDILQCHTNIEQAMREVMERYPQSFYVSIGGDHSITAPLVRALKEGKRIGILQFDTHLDLRDLSNGPSNGTPIRQLLEAGVVRGEDVYNIGLHGFYNAPSLIEAARYYNVNIITLKQLRKTGIQQQIAEVMQALSEKVDVIYVTVDIDVLDITYAPGVPASTPGGMRTDELFDLLFEVGKSNLVCAVDFVCIDPHRDTQEAQTVKAVTYAFLTTLVSRYMHMKNTHGD
ncbi:agmatinase family protein [Solibacillus sp. CAU 1738]|uniref:agmatinase family protein n=1 Tax=Solibacillus sp. CAU 1738 TaxID=3140363 RepID=UPI003261BA36